MRYSTAKRVAANLSAQTWKTDVTDRAADLIGDAVNVPRLPTGYTVRAWLVPEVTQPTDLGPAYVCDIDEGDPAHPAAAFCRWCGQWVRQLDQPGAARVNRAHPTDADNQPVAVVGDWVHGEAGIKCPEADTHEPDDPLVVRMWQDREFSFATLTVEVLDRRGHQRGVGKVDNAEQGRFPSEIDPDTGEVSYIQLDPLTDPHPLTAALTAALMNMHDRRGGWRRLLWWLARH